MSKKSHPKKHRPRTPGSGRPSLGGDGPAPHVSITMTAEMMAAARERIGDGNLSRACQRAVAYWLEMHPEMNE